MQNQQWHLHAECNDSQSLNEPRFAHFGYINFRGAISLSYAKPEHHEEKIYADDRGMFHSVGTINGLLAEKYFMPDIQ